MARARRNPSPTRRARRLSSADFAATFPGWTASQIAAHIGLARRKKCAIGRYLERRYALEHPLERETVKRERDKPDAAGLRMATRFTATWGIGHARPLGSEDGEIDLLSAEVREKIAKHNRRLLAFRVVFVETGYAEPQAGTIHWGKIVTKIRGRTWAEAEERAFMARADQAARQYRYGQALLMRRIDLYTRSGWRVPRKKKTKKSR